MKKNPAGIIIAGVVLIVGFIIIWKFISFMNRHFVHGDPGDPPFEPNITNVMHQAVSPIQNLQPEHVDALAKLSRVGTVKPDGSGCIFSFTVGMKPPFIVERSHDLRTWTAVKTNWSELVVIDGSCSNSFYRVKNN